MPTASNSDATTSISLSTGRLFGDLWDRYDDDLFKESVELWEKRWLANGEPADFFHGKKCLDAGCGGGRYVFAMRLMGADQVIGIDVGEAGLDDARRRAAASGLTGVEFRQASVLDLPVGDEEIDFAVCSGVLHHTPSVERGLAELYRVLKPGGSLYLLLYGAGGLYWPLNLVTRPFAAALGYAEVDRCIAEAGFAANKRRTILDDLFVPILETYSPERVDALLTDAGFARWRRWGTAQMDHESDPAAMISELRQRLQVWEAGSASSADPQAARIEHQLALLCASVIAAAEHLVEDQKQGRLSETDLRRAIIGAGHHRIIAEKP